jgi:hypothetical protein
MRRRLFCYYHDHTTRRPNPRPTHLPLLEDANAIQLGIAEIMRRIMLGDIEYKAAGLLLYGFQLASQNLARMSIEPYWKDVVVRDLIEEAQEAEQHRERAEVNRMLEAAKESEMKKEPEAAGIQGSVIEKDKLG